VQRQEKGKKRRRRRRRTKRLYLSCLGGRRYCSKTLGKRFVNFL
jgi:hypothetical protein